MPLTFTVTNVGSQTIAATLGACKFFDTKVTSSAQPIWQESLVGGCIGSITDVSIAPGETKTYTSTWTQLDQHGNQVPPGSYTLTSWYQPYNSIDSNLSPGNQEVNEAAGPIQVIVQ